MEFLRSFVKKLLVFDVIFGARTKKLAGINDKDNLITTDLVISDTDNSITFTNNDLPTKFLKIGGYFRIFGGPNNKNLFSVKEITGNKLYVNETVSNDTNSRTIDARLWVVHDDNSISRESPTGGTMFNVDNMDDTGTPCDGSGVAKVSTTHYHTDYQERKKHNVIPDGDKNNDNLVYTLPNGEVFVAGTLEVYLSHLHLDNDQFIPNATNTGFTIVLEPNNRWKLNCPPLQDESLTINYLQDVK